MEHDLFFGKRVKLFISRLLKVGGQCVVSGSPFCLVGVTMREEGASHFKEKLLSTTLVGDYENCWSIGGTAKNQRSY